MVIKNLFKVLKGIWIFLLLVIFTVLILSYSQTVIYDFPPPKPFAGSHWYSPYEDLPADRFRINLHGHSRAWGGLTNGADTPEALQRAYADSGYTVAGLSNYHKISPPTPGLDLVDIPLYEHGYNVFKSHRLAIDAHDVSWFDYPLFQWTSHRQHLIDDVKKTASLVCVNHPKVRNGHPKSDLRLLTGYDLMEVRTAYGWFAEWWDTALSAGRPVFLLVNDDTHLVARQSFWAWTVVYGKSRDKAGILDGLSSGAAIGVSCEKWARCDVYLDSLTVKGDRLQAFFSDTLEHIQVTGQDGRQLTESFNTDRIAYTLQDNDPYARVSGSRAGQVIWLNPVIRYNGQDLKEQYNMSAQRNNLLTFLVRIAVVVLSLALFWWILILLGVKRARIFKKKE
jgi:hypothetical protein